MQVVIFETMLSDKLVGHEGWVKELAGYLLSDFGDQVTIVGQKSLSPVVRRAIGDQYKYDARFSSSHLLRSKGAEVDQAYRKFRQNMALETAKIVSDYAEADVHIFPTALPTTAAGVAMAQKRAPLTSLLFHFSHAQQSDKFMLEARSPLTFYQQHAKRQVKCFSTSPGLATELGELGIFGQHAPYPCYLPKATRQSSGQCRRVGIFGHQRPEKDGGLILPLMNALLGEGYQVVFQNSKDDSVHLTHPNLQIINNYLSPDAFNELVASCDATVITNEPDFFNHRISGVTLDALANGIPVVVPANTHMARLATRFGAGSVYKERSVNSIIKALGRTRRRYDTEWSGAARCARWLQAEAGYARLAASLRG